MIRFVLSLCILVSIISTVSAITVNPEYPNLPSQLNEGTPVNFTLKIEDLDHRNADNLIIETNLVESGNSPIYDFGDLNKYIDTNRYQQNLYLNLSLIPQNKMIIVHVSGQTPSGEIRNKVQDNLILTKFLDGDLKYYEVDNGNEVCKIQTFKLNIQKKENFEDTMQQINLNELGPLKKDVRELFNIGLVTEAQQMASDMNGINLHDYLKLFTIVDVKTDFSLNIIAISFLSFGFILGYVCRMKREVREEE